MVENRTDNPLTLKLGREELIIRLISHIHVKRIPASNCES